MCALLYSRPARVLSTVLQAWLREFASFDCVYIYGMVDSLDEYDRRIRENKECRQQSLDHRDVSDCRQAAIRFQRCSERDSSIKAKGQDRIQVIQ